MKGRCHDSPPQPVRRRARADEGVFRLLHPGRRERPRKAVAGAGQDPRLADQRLRQLPQHAHLRGAPGRRDRAAHPSDRGMARGAVLQRARARRSGLDRAYDVGRRKARARRCLCRAGRAVQQGGAAQADDDDHHDQRLEPPRGRLRPVRSQLWLEGVNQAGAATFDALRPKLTRVAYRMLGSVADAEDVVQDAWLRWADTDQGAVRVPEAFLRRVVTRLCLDQLKSARVRREEYVGPWLPEPVVEAEQEADDVTLPLMLALERLSPLERAAIQQPDVFGESFDDVAASLGRDSAACRQLAEMAAHQATDRGEGAGH